METYGEDPVPHRPHGRAVHQGPAGRRSEVSQDHRHRQTLRRPQRTRIAAPHLRRRDRRARPLRHLPAAVRSRDQGRRRVLGDVRLQPRGRPARLRQPAPARRHSAQAVGLLRATWSPIAAPSAISISTTRSSPNAPSRRGARRQGRHRPELRRGVRQPAAGRSQRPARRSRDRPGRAAPADGALQAGHVRSARAWCKYAQIPYSVNDSAAHRELALGDRPQIDRAAEERGRRAAAQQVAEDASR